MTACSIDAMPQAGSASDSLPDAVIAFLTDAIGDATASVPLSATSSLRQAGICQSTRRIDGDGCLELLQGSSSSCEGLLLEVVAT